MPLLHISSLECCHAAAQEESNRCHSKTKDFTFWRPISSLVAFLRAMHPLQASQTFHTQPQFSSQPKGMKHRLDLDFGFWDFKFWIFGFLSFWILGTSAAQFHPDLSVCCVEGPGQVLPEFFQKFEVCFQAINLCCLCWRGGCMNCQYTQNGLDFYRWISGDMVLPLWTCWHKLLAVFFLLCHFFFWAERDFLMFLAISFG